jgi:hypothetical protein
MSAVEKDTVSQYAVEIRNCSFLHPTVLGRIEYWHQGSVAHLELTVIDVGRFLEIIVQRFFRSPMRHNSKKNSSPNLRAKYRKPFRCLKPGKFLKQSQAATNNEHCTDGESVLS